MSFLYSGSLWSSLYCDFSSLCVGLYRWLVKVSWLGKLVSVFWWVELYFFSLFSRAPFEELDCFSGCLMSSAGIQKLFCGIYSTFKCSFDEFVGEKVFSLSYSSAIFWSFLVLTLKRQAHCGHRGRSWTDKQTPRPQEQIWPRNYSNQAGHYPSRQAPVEVWSQTGQLMGLLGPFLLFNSVFIGLKYVSLSRGPKENNNNDNKKTLSIPNPTWKDIRN